MECKGLYIKLKICIIVDDYMPHSHKVGAKMMHELATELILNGHSVTVITPCSNLKENYKLGRIDKVDILYFKSGLIKTTFKSTRAINESLLSYRAWNSLKWFFSENHHDLIIYYSPSIFFGTLVKKLKKLWKSPSYLILRDIFPQWIIDNGIISENSLSSKYFKFFEKINYDSADTIGIQSEKNIEWFSKNYTIQKPLDLLYNWSTDKSEIVKNNGYRKKFDLEDKIVFFYGGNIGHAQDMMNIIRLAKNMLSEKKAHFLLVGSGSEVDLVKESISKYNLTNLTYLPPVSQEEFKKMSSEFDIGLFSLDRNHKAHNFPGKILAYMIEDMPILGSINLDNDIKEVIEEAGAGFITVNGDDEGLKNNALKLLDDNLRKEMGNKSNILLKKTFSVTTAADKILDFYKIYTKNQ